MLSFREEDSAWNLAYGMIVHEDLHALVTDKGDAGSAGRRTGTAGIADLRLLLLVSRTGQHRQTRVPWERWVYFAECAEQEPRAFAGGNTLRVAAIGTQTEAGGIG
jgi:hypothetical protein